MGMTNEQFKAYVQMLKNEIVEYREMSKSPSPEMREFAEKKLDNLVQTLQEVLER